MQATLCAAALLGVAGIAEAQPTISTEPDTSTTAPSPDTWTLDAVLAAAAERSPRVRAAKASRDAASAYGAYAEQPPVGNPIVSMRALVGIDAQQASTFGVGVALPVDLSGRTSAWRREASLVMRQAEAQLALAITNARAEAASAYIDVAVADAQLDVARQRAETALVLRESTETRLQAGAATALDASLAAREHAEADADVVRAEHTLEQARARLREILGLEPLAPVAVAPLTPPIAEDRSPEELVRLARARRQELTALRAEAARWRAMEDRVRREAIDPVYVGLEAERQGATTAMHAAGGSVSAALPFVRTARPDRQVALAQATRAGADLDLAEQAVALDAVAAWRALRDALRELVVVEERTVPAADESMRLAERLLQTGATDLFRVLSVRRDLYTHRTRRNELVRDAWRARAALDRAVGGVSP